MQLSSKGRYAVMALADLAFEGLVGPSDEGDHAIAAADQVDLARNQPVSTQPVRTLPIRTKAVSERQNISQAYLEQIFMLLRRKDLVKSSRGPGGGYVLTRAPEDISIYEIMQAVDEPVQMTRCSLNEVGGCVAGHRCLTHDLWQDLGSHITSFLKGTSLADVISGSSLNVSTDDHAEDLMLTGQEERR